MKHSARRTVVWLIAIVLAVFAWKFEQVCSLVLIRAATPAELDSQFDGDPHSRAFGYWHRWSDKPIGTWVQYYGWTDVVHRMWEYGPEGLQLETEWRPDGKLWVQISADRGFSRAYEPPWRMEKKDQEIGTTQLRGCSITSMRLDFIDLSNADLRDAELWGCTFRGTNLRGARLEGADLTGANFVDVKNLTIEQVLSASYWNMNARQRPTRFPLAIGEELTGHGLQARRFLDDLSEDR